MRIFQGVNEDENLGAEDRSRIADREYRRQCELAKRRGMTVDESGDLDDLGHSPFTGLWFDRFSY